MQQQDAYDAIEMLRADMRRAMKNRNMDEIDALRSLLARIDNAGAIPHNDQGFAGSTPIAGAESGVGSTEARRKTLNLQDVHAIIREEINEITTTMNQIDSQLPYAKQLERKLAVLEKYTP